MSNDNVFKLADILPAVAKRLAEGQASERAPEDDRREHRRQASVTSARVEAIRRIPPVYGDAFLTSQWLLTLVGEDTMLRAASSIRERSVALLGPPGAGKSSLAAAMFRACAAEDEDPRSLAGYRWMSSHKLAKARAGQRLGEGEAPDVETALGASLLVLDELGGEDPRYASAVAEVLYERYEQARPTWVTTGVGSKEIATRYGGGIARRVFENAAVFRLAGRR